MTSNSLPMDNAFNLLGPPRPRLLTRPDGYGVYMVELNQRCIYEGLLEGYPWKSLNAQLISEARERATRFGKPVVLIEPRRGIPPNVGMPSSPPVAQYELLPLIYCEARLLNWVAPGVYELTLVWFQDTLALPIDPVILEAIREIDWPNSARFYDSVDG